MADTFNGGLPGGGAVNAAAGYTLSQFGEAVKVPMMNFCFTVKLTFDDGSKTSLLLGQVGNHKAGDYALDTADLIINTPGWPKKLESFLIFTPIAMLLGMQNVWMMRGRHLTVMSTSGDAGWFFDMSDHGAGYFAVAGYEKGFKFSKM